MKLIDQIKVRYNTKDIGRYTNKPVDYMHTIINGTELYAEAPVGQNNDEDTYLELETKILKQAITASIDKERLLFWYYEGERDNEN